MLTHQGLVFNLLADEFVFTEGVARLPGDAVYRSLLHLLLDGTVQHEQRFTRTLLERERRGRETERKHISIKDIKCISTADSYKTLV